VARAALCIWIILGITFSASVATVFELHTFTNPLIRFSLYIVSGFVSIRGRVPGFISLRILGVSCAASSLVNAGLNWFLLFARSIERFEFHPTLKAPASFSSLLLV